MQDDIAACKRMAELLCHCQQKLRFPSTVTYTMKYYLVFADPASGMYVTTSEMSQTP